MKKKIKVLFENKTNNINQYFGRDEYNNSVIVNSSENLTGKIYNVHVSSLNQILCSERLILILTTVFCSLIMSELINANQKFKYKKN